MECTDFPRALHDPWDRHVLHQAVHAIHAGVRARHSARRRTRSRAIADGAGRRRDSRRPYAGVLSPLSRPHLALFFLAAGFGSSILLFASSRDFRLSLLCLFFAGGFQTTFLSSTATLLQIHADETNRGRIMSLFGLINRGLGPMGSFPFGLLASAIGAPWTVAACGLLTIALVGYMAFFRTGLRYASRVGEA